MPSSQVEIYGASEHNLKHIDVTFPRDALVVVTGVSGSGKSTLAFDTIYNEGQYRYMQSFSAYARSFIGELRRPHVDKIEGLSPVISIEQRTTSRNPRSTVGTATEIYDFLRVLYARTAEAYSYLSGQRMTSQSADEMKAQCVQHFTGQRITLLSPLVRGRKGHYRELFVQLRKQGFSRVRIDGKVEALRPDMQLDRFKIHDVELVIDSFTLDGDTFRLDQSLALALTRGRGVAIVLDASANLHYFSKHLVDPLTGLSYEEPAPNTFSFNTTQGACPQCRGLGEVKEVDLARIIPDPALGIGQGALAPMEKSRSQQLLALIRHMLKDRGCDLYTPFKELPQTLQAQLFRGTVTTGAPVLDDGILETFEAYGMVGLLERSKLSPSQHVQRWGERFMSITVCPACQGMRLKKEALHYKIDGKNIAEISAWSLDALKPWLGTLTKDMSPPRRAIAEEVLKEICPRVDMLRSLGLHYLSLSRPMRSLSGGEAQRIRLAAQIGNKLVEVLYILDEPSIGLHARDNDKLISALRLLRDYGNTVLVVEHDRDMMLASDHLIDIGPRAGKHGGEVVASGTPADVLTQDSLTAAYLRGEQTIAVPKRRRKGNKEALVLSGAQGYNLKNLTFRLPLECMVCLTGVSGSGKSTLVHETLVPILKHRFYRAHKRPLAYEKIEGLEYVDKVIEIDQAPIGRTPRSNPVTYTGIFTDIRAWFTQLPESKIRGYVQGRFSFNVKGGRCELCMGGGMRLIEMDFLPDVYVECEACRGQRYSDETLEVHYKGKSIADVLNMNVHEAVAFFSAHPEIHRKLEVLEEVGLGYIGLGQHATTLSGGEAQRVKLAAELLRRSTGRTLYVLDEPTTGLHFEDIRHLLAILQTLVQQGNTVLIIEHNMDVIKVADHVVDMGPEGGLEGGYMVCEGTPEEVAKSGKGYTAGFLAKELARS